MSTNFRKTKSFGNTRVSLGKKGVSISSGVKGARVSINTKGDVYGTVGIPGSGVYSRKKLNGNIQSTHSGSETTSFSYSDNDLAALESQIRDQKYAVSKIDKENKLRKICYILYLVLGVVLLFFGLIFAIAEMVSGYVFVVFGLLCVLISLLFKSKYKKVQRQISECNDHIKKSKQLIYEMKQSE